MKLHLKLLDVMIIDESTFRAVSRLKRAKGGDGVWSRRKILSLLKDDPRSMNVQYI